MYRSAVRSQPLCHLRGRTETGREHQVDTLPNLSARRRVRTRCNRIKVLLNMPRHDWIGSRHGSVNVASVTDDAIEFVVELNRGSKETPICVGSVWTCMREINRQPPKT